eukprot:c18126_g1_i1.p1 GENE.c18126_g1_i1~~c18126_g1_i1.p1  ORF type:complete len:164 (-),score=62.73 c18126_g1_i1:151-642(-)
MNAAPSSWYIPIVMNHNDHGLLGSTISSLKPQNSSDTKSQQQQQQTSSLEHTTSSITPSLSEQQQQHEEYSIHSEQQQISSSSLSSLSKFQSTTTQKKGNFISVSTNSLSSKPSEIQFINNLEKLQTAFNRTVEFAGMTQTFETNPSLRKYQKKFISSLIFTP